MSNPLNPLRHAAASTLQFARMATDSDTRIFKLFQLRDIILNRQKELLPQLIPEIFSFIHVDRSTAMRQFLIQFSGELMEQVPIITAPYVVNLYSTLLIQKDCSDAVRAEIGRKIAQFYRMIVLSLRSIGISIPSQRMHGSSTGHNIGGTTSDGLQLWSTFNAVVNKFKMYLKTRRSEFLRVQALNVVESELLFWLPGPTAAAAPGEREESNMDEIRPDHPFIKVELLQTDAEDMLKKLGQWLCSGGPAGFPFSPSVVSQLGRILAHIAVKKPSRAVLVAKLFVSLFNPVDKRSKLLSEMPDTEVQDLCHSAHRLLHHAIVYSTDASGHMATLLKAVNAVENNKSTPFVIEEIEFEDRIGNSAALPVNIQHLSGNKRVAPDNEVIELEERDSEADNTFLFDRVYEALVCYRQQFPDHTRIPARYVIPESPNIPRSLWGVKLGRIFYRMKERGNYKQYHAKVFALGFTFDPMYASAETSANAESEPKEGSKRVRIHRTEDEYLSEVGRFFEALQIYRRFYPDHIRILPTYVVPSGQESLYPAHLWGLDLGYQFSRVLTSNLYKEYKERVIGLGFNLTVRRHAQRPDAEQILEAFGAYKLAYPEQDTVPVKFVVPENTHVFPIQTWGIKLGCIYKEMKKTKGIHKQLYPKVRALGFNLRMIEND